MKGRPETKSSSAMASNFSSTTKARRICAAQPWIFATVSPAPVFRSRIRTRAEPAAVGRHSKWRSKRPSGSDLERARFHPARLDGLRPLSVRRTVRAARAAPNQLLRLDGRDFTADGVRVCRLARQFLHLQPTRTAGQLSYSAEAAQDRAAQAI